MSNKLSGYVWDGCAASGMKISSVAIMARLADFSSDEGVSWPSIETIARQTGAGISTVRTAIAQLEKEGWITRKQRRQGNRNASNIYQLNIAKLAAAASFQRPESDGSKSDGSESDGSNFDGSNSGNKSGFHPSESGGDPSVNSNTDPSVKKISLSESNGGVSDDENHEPKGNQPSKGKWGEPEDHKCAEWIFSRIKKLYEKAAESDGELTRPKDPNWNSWANEIRLMRTVDGRSHRQICDLFKRIQNDPFWCRNVLSPSKLREKWDELIIRLGTGGQLRDINTISEVDTRIPEGFRG